jgi:hypothetical protein
MIAATAVATQLDKTNMTPSQQHKRTPTASRFQGYSYTFEKRCLFSASNPNKHPLTARLW